MATVVDVSTDFNKRQEGQRPSISSARLLRDVGVNVLANLIAAAIIYLAGALLGLLPRSPAAIAGATSLLVMVGGIALQILAFRRGWHGLPWFAVGASLVAAVAAGTLLSSSNPSRFALAAWWSLLVAIQFLGTFVSDRYLTSRANRQESSRLST
nr:hypothetical protein [Actinoplanes octamycinicus]